MDVIMVLLYVVANTFICCIIDRAVLASKPDVGSWKQGKKSE